MKARPRMLVAVSAVLLGLSLAAAIYLRSAEAGEHDCQAVAVRAKECFQGCWNRIQSQPLRPCLTGTMRRCQAECRPIDDVARACRRELPDVFRKCCFLCPPAP